VSGWPATPLLFGRSDAARCFVEAERRAYRIVDNKLTELGDWDEALLRDEIAGHCTLRPWPTA